MRHAAITLFLLLAAALPVQAQPNYQDPGTRAKCREARPIVESGQPADRERWAAVWITACPPAERGAALAVAVRRWRESTDASLLEELWVRARRLTDAAVFAAAYEIAGDRSASTEARLFALLALRAAVNPVRVPQYEDLLQDGQLCRLTVTVGGNPPETGAPLPPGAARRATELVARIRDDPTEPPAIRRGARCAMR